MSRDCRSCSLCDRKKSDEKEHFERDFPEEKRGPVWSVLERAALTAPLPLGPEAGRRAGPHELPRASFVDPVLCEASKASVLLEHPKGRCKIQRSFVTPNTLWERERESPGADVSVLEDACKKKKAVCPLLEPFKVPHPLGRRLVEGECRTVFYRAPSPEDRFTG